MCFISKIESYMKKNNLTQHDFATLIETNDSQVNRWLREKNKISKSWKFVIKNKLSID